LQRFNFQRAIIRRPRPEGPKIQSEKCTEIRNEFVSIWLRRRRVFSPTYEVFYPHIYRSEFEESFPRFAARFCGASGCSAPSRLANLCPEFLQLRPSNCDLHRIASQA